MRLKKIIYAGIYSLLSFISINANCETEQIGPFGPLNNTDNSFIISANQAQDLLNVETTDGNKSIKKRKGYGTAFTLSNATSPVHGVYNFYDTNGSDVSLFFNDRRMNVSVSGAGPVVFFSTGTNGATYQCVDTAGFAYCANTSRDGIIKVNSSTYTLLSGFTSTGTMVTVTPERLVQAGFSSNTSLVWFSKANDFATWTVGGNATDPITFIVTSPGSGIKHITYAHGRVYWFKDSSFGYILEGATQSDWQVVTVSNFLGTLYNTSIFRDDILYFQGNDGHFYAFDGATVVKLSKDIQATINQTQGRSSNSWSQTATSDWDAGLITTTTWLNTTAYPGSVALTTAVALGPYINNISSSYVLGTLSNMSTTYTSITISTEANSYSVLKTTLASVSNAVPLGIDPENQAFYSNVGFFLTSATFMLEKSPGVGSGLVGISLKSNNVDVPGSILATSTANLSSFCEASSTIAIFGSSMNVVFNFTPIQLNSNTTYWFSFNFSTPSGPSGFIFFDTSYSSMTKRSGSSTDYSPFIFSTYGKRFNSSGSFISSSFDTTIDTYNWTWQWSNFDATGTIPSGSSVTYRMQYSNDNTNWSNTIVVSTGSAPSVPVSRYVRYLSTFTTTDLSTAPIVSSFTITATSRMRPWGTFDSQIKNAPSLSSWDSFSADYLTVGGGSHTFYIRSSTGVFYASATVPAWTSVSNGAIPSISTNPYFQIRDVIQTGNYAYNPLLNSFTQNWFEGAASDKTYAIYHDNYNWWSVASGTGATTNNKILRFNLIDPGWYIFDIGTGGMYVKGQSLYFGDVSTGKVFKYGDTDNDNGSAINAYWESKDFFGASPFLDKDYSRMSTAWKAVSNSTATLTYIIDGSSSTSYNVNLGSSTSSFIQKNVNIPQGKTGKTISVRFGNNAADQYFEIFGGAVDYTPKSWTPK